MHFRLPVQPPALADHTHPPARPGEGDTGFINAVAFGVDPHNAKNTTASAEALFTAAVAANRPAYFPPGTYRMSDADVPAGCRIVGAGPTTVFKRVPGAATSTILSLTGDDISVTGVTLDGSRGSGGATAGASVTVTTDISRFRADRCRVQNAEATGFWIVDPIRQVVVTDCDFVDMRDAGVKIECFTTAPEPHDIRVSGCRFDSTVNYPYGFIVRSNTSPISPEMYEVRVTDNYVRMPGNFVSGTGGITFGGFGIEVWASRVIVSGNEIAYNSTTTADEIGLSIVAGDGVVIANQVTNAGLGIEAGGTSRRGLRVAANSLRNCRNGIASFGTAERVSISDNEIEGFTGTGIFASQDSVISGNKLSGSAASGAGNTFGIKLQNTARPSEDPLIVGNIISIAFVAAGTARLAIWLENIERFCLVGNKVNVADYGVRVDGTVGQVHKGVMVGNDWTGCLFDAFIKAGASTIGDLVRWGNPGGTPSDTPAVTGSRGGNAALANLLTVMAGRKVIVDSTTA